LCIVRSRCSGRIIKFCKDKANRHRQGRRGVRPRVVEGLKGGRGGGGDVLPAPHLPLLMYPTCCWKLFRINAGAERDMTPPLSPWLCHPLFR
jgi:hypothetical protein